MKLNKEELSKLTPADLIELKDHCLSSANILPEKKYYYLEIVGLLIMEIEQRIETLIIK